MTSFSPLPTTRSSHSSIIHVSLSLIKSGACALPRHASNQFYLPQNSAHLFQFLLTSMYRVRVVTRTGKLIVFPQPNLISTANRALAYSRICLSNFTFTNDNPPARKMSSFKKRRTRRSRKSGMLSASCLGNENERKHSTWRAQKWGEETHFHVSLGSHRSEYPNQRRRYPCRIN